MFQSFFAYGIVVIIGMGIGVDVDVGFRKELQVQYSERNEKKDRIG